MTALIRIDSARFSVLPADDQAKELIEAALTRAAAVPVEIDTEKDQAVAVEAQREVKTLLKNIEQARKSAKDPVIALGREIDKHAEALTAELKSEELRIARAVGDYQQRIAEMQRAEARKRAEAEAELERQRQAELDRIRREQEAIAAEAKRKADEEARIAREKAEAEARAARNKQERILAQQRAEAAAKRAEEARIRAEAEAAKRLQEEMQRAAELHKQAQEMLPPAPVAAKADGQMVKPVLLHEVTDIHALYRANPGLVELTPRKREINELLNMLDQRGDTLPSFPGLRVWREVRSTVRTTRSQATIEV